MMWNLRRCCFSFPPVFNLNTSVTGGKRRNRIQSAADDWCWSDLERWRQKSIWVCKSNQVLQPRMARRTLQNLWSNLKSVIGSKFTFATTGGCIQRTERDGSWGENCSWRRMQQLPSSSSHDQAWRARLYSDRRWQNWWHHTGRQDMQTGSNQQELSLR